MALQVQSESKLQDQDAPSQKISKLKLDFAQQLALTPAFDMHKIKQYFTHTKGCELTQNDAQNGKYSFICKSYADTMDLYVVITTSINEVQIRSTPTIKWPKQVKIEELDLPEWQKHYGFFVYKVVIDGLTPTGILMGIRNGVLIKNNKPHFISGSKIIQNVFKPLVLATAPDKVTWTDEAKFICKLR